MGALKALIQRLHAQAATPVTRAVTPAVTPVTPQKTAGVTEKFNEINGVTPVTRVTPQKSNDGMQCTPLHGAMLRRSRLWL